MIGVPHLRAHFDRSQFFPQYPRFLIQSIPLLLCLEKLFLKAPLPCFYLRKSHRGCLAISVIGVVARSPVFWTSRGITVRRSLLLPLSGYPELLRTFRVFGYGNTMGLTGYCCSIIPGAKSNRSGLSAYNRTYVSPPTTWYMHISPTDVYILSHNSRLTCPKEQKPASPAGLPQTRGKHAIAVAVPRILISRSRRHNWSPPVRIWLSLRSLLLYKI